MSSRIDTLHNGTLLLCRRCFICADDNNCMFLYLAIIWSKCKWRTAHANHYIYERRSTYLTPLTFKTCTLYPTSNPFSTLKSSLVTRCATPWAALLGKQFIFSCKSGWSTPTARVLFSWSEWREVEEGGGRGIRFAYPNGATKGRGQDDRGIDCMGRMHSIF